MVGAKGRARQNQKKRDAARIHLSDLLACPNCGTVHKEDNFKPSFRFSTLIECLDCRKKVKLNNSAKISDMPNMF